jgi:DNA damage-binding protein 1
MLERIRPAASRTDHLFVGTDRYQYFTCSWNDATKQIKTEQSYVDQADKVLRDSRDMDRCHIDPTSRFLTLELYDGVVTVVPIEQPSESQYRFE